MMYSEYDHRTRLLMGDSGMERLQACRVLLVGIGGVGSWCAESLVRSGVGHLTIVDADTVCPTNINRQLMALPSTIGQPKTEVLRQRLLSIRPDAEITTLQRRYTAADSESFRLGDYDYVIDCIDALQDKADLILRVCALPARSDGSRTRLLSSMGAALKMDPTQIEVAEFWKVKGCPLARALRQLMKKHQTLPRRKFRCVFSPELLANQNLSNENPEEANLYNKVQTNGSMAHITAIFGFTLAGLLIKDLYEA